jgi:hypothetical protein
VTSTRRPHAHASVRERICLLDEVCLFAGLFTPVMAYPTSDEPSRDSVS